MLPDAFVFPRFLKTFCYAFFMKVLYDKAVLHSPLEVLRRAGYSAFVDPVTKDESFVLRLTSGYYPRFHIYVEDRGSDVSISLHLDQKQATYGENHAHSGEYEGAAIEQEMHRIDGWVTQTRKEHESQLRDDNQDGLPRPWWRLW